MAFGWAGAAAGASQGLEEIMAQQMMRAQMVQRQQEAAAQLAQRKTEESNRASEAAENRSFRNSQQARQDADAILQDAAPGPISEVVAGILSKSPVGQSRLTTRRVIEGVRPIKGTTALDESGPQSFNVLEPTNAQAQAQHKRTQLAGISKILSGATTEQQRRSVGAQALADDIDIPNSLLGQTDAEKEAQRMADERRDGAEWERRNNITNAQANARQAQSDKLMRERAGEARDDKPPTNAQTTIAGYAARVEQSNPQLSGLEKSITAMNPLSFEAQLWADRPALQSKEIQQYAQASRNFINAVLRRESGAVISPEEFATARKQYLPVPGDLPETLQMKRANRALIHQTYKQGAGKAYQSLDDALGGNTPLTVGTPGQTRGGGSALSVTAPNGKTYTFTSAQKLADFKAQLGIK
jgi:hypothetical protein